MVSHRFMSLEELRDRIAIVVPVHFQASVPREQVESVLEATFTDQDLFCDRENVQVVVDRHTAADSVLELAPQSSPLFGLHRHQLDQNQGKTGAIREGLRALLKRSSRPFLITRDCDGDAALSDLPAMVTLAESLSRAGHPSFAVFGARPSMHRPMNWEREQWERLTNQLFIDLTEFILASKRQLLDRRFWNALPLDLQSGYRLYNRASARLAVDSLDRLPEEREVYLMACEMTPFLELTLQGGVVGQVERSTQVEQPVSSYGGVDFASAYARLLMYTAEEYLISRELVLRMVDNELANSPAWFSRMREELERFRRHISDEPKLLLPPVM